MASFIQPYSFTLSIITAVFAFVPQRQPDLWLVLITCLIIKNKINSLKGNRFIKLLQVSFCIIFCHDLQNNLLEYFSSSLLVHLISLPFRITRNFLMMLLKNKIKREHELTQWSESMTLQIFSKENLHTHLKITLTKQKVELYLMEICHVRKKTYFLMFLSYFSS